MFGLSKKTLVIAGAVIAGILVLSAFARSGDANAGDGTAASGSGGCAYTVTADALNVRSGPSQQDAVVGSLAHGKKVTASDTVQHGYRKLGDNRWAAKKFLAPVGDGC